MPSSQDVTARLGFERSDVAAALLARARQGPPVLLAGPPGAGKTTLLRALADDLVREGWTPVYLDLMGAASSPERFVTAALRVLPAEAFARRLAQATEIRRLADSGREQGAAAVQALFSLWASLDEAAGRPVALLLDEATEIRSLAYFAGLRNLHRPFGAALAARRRGTVLATSFPTAARRLWPFDAIEARPLTGLDVAPLLARLGAALDPQALVGACFGWPRYARILLDRVEQGPDLASAWALEMGPGGRLELACRQTYESLLLRSRGYGMSKAVLDAVAHEEGLNLTALVARLGRTPGAVRDYLQWLVHVDALRMTRKRYHYVDEMVRWWVRLHARGTVPSGSELAAAAAEVVAGAPAASAPALVTAGRVEEPASPPRRPDSLMEID